MRSATLAALAALLLAPALQAQTAIPLPVSQDWSNPALITVDDDWSTVPGFIGYRGDDILTATFGVDPQTILADGSSTPVDINADEADPTAFSSGGLAEFAIANPTVAMQGSGTADVPHLVLRVNTTGFQNIRVQYNLRDIDAGVTDAVQPFALQYRVGTTGDYTNLPGGYVADASGPSGEATKVTAIDVTLPANANNQPSVDIRWVTVNVQGTDEMIGIDDISVTGGLIVAGEAGPEADFGLTVANPLRGTALVRYTATTPDVTLALYSVTGRRVATLQAAHGTATLDATGLAAGAYVLRLEAGGRSASRLLSVVR